MVRREGSPAQPDFPTPIVLSPLRGWSARDRHFSRDSTIPAERKKIRKFWPRCLDVDYNCIYNYMQREIKNNMAAQTQDRTEDVIARECLVVRLRMLNRVVTNIYDDALRPLGVKASQLNILVVTAKLGLARPAEVCQRLQLNTSTLSRNVERMRARDWLEVVNDDDGRAQPFRLTAKGRRLLDRAMPAWEKAQGKVKKLIGADAVASIDNAVRRIRTEQPPS